MFSKSSLQNRIFEFRDFRCFQDKLGKSDFEISDVFQDSLENRISDYQLALSNVDLTSRLIDRSAIFFDEIRIMLEILKKNNFQELQKYLSSTKELFRGGQGIRHIDFVGYKIESPSK